METTNICLYTNGECRAKEFVEEDYLCFYKDGSIHYINFTEGSTSIKLAPEAFYATELSERYTAKLTDELDIYLIDEYGNYLTTII